MRNKYYTKPLVKAINEVYFREYRHIDRLRKINEAITSTDVATYQVHILNNKIKDTNLVNLLKDLHNTTLGNLDNFKSELGKSLYTRLKNSCKKIVHEIDSLKDSRLELLTILDEEFKEDSYIVGGFIRDIISNRESKDIDICTSVPYDVLASKFKELGWVTKETGKHFLVLLVIHPKTNEQFEIASLRKDKDNSGAKVGTITEDSERRDFVNSTLYWSLRNNELVDPSGEALEDCLANKLRFVGRAKDRILEDPLRVFRGYRFIQRGWVPDKRTLKALRENFNNALTNVNFERVRVEIEKMIGL